MKYPYKICFLGYRDLTKMAQQTIKDMQLKDTEFLVRDCTPDTIQEVIDEAIAYGCEAFIGGGSNYAAFKQHSTMFIQELPVTNVDYLTALLKSEKLGSRPAIVQYKYRQPIDIELIRQLFRKDVGLIVYEDTAQLSEMIRNSSYDVLIGTSLIRDYAVQYGREHVLSYEGMETIRTAIIRVRNRIGMLRREQRYRAINDALIHDTDVGIIITNQEGYITLINAKAEEFLSLGSGTAQGRLLADVQRNLTPRQDSLQEFFRVVQSIRLRCTQKPIWMNGEIIGHFTLLRIDNSRIANVQAPVDPDLISSAPLQWTDMISESPAMKKAITYGKQLSTSPMPTAVLGEPGTNRKLFAQCLHSSSSRAGKPLLFLNLATISESNAGRYLFGSQDTIAPHTGILEAANGGTLVLTNLPLACTAVQACLMDAVSSGQITPIGGYQTIGLNIRFITILDKVLDESRVHGGLLQLLTTGQVEMPSLRERREDLTPLFERELNRHLQKKLKIRRYHKITDLISWYDWPLNLPELQRVAACCAFVYQQKSETTPTEAFKELVSAIGKDKLCEQAEGTYANSPQSPEDFMKMVEDLGRYADLTQTEVAERLGISRTTLWRKMGRT